jgi:hypothetical protein
MIASCTKAYFSSQHFSVVNIFDKIKRNRKIWKRLSEKVDKVFEMVSC